jgi:type 2 lantibiotic biosynthesis protein LanM
MNRLTKYTAYPKAFYLHELAHSHSNEGSLDSAKVKKWLHQSGLPESLLYQRLQKDRLTPRSFAYLLDHIDEIYAKQSQAPAWANKLEQIFDDSTENEKVTLKNQHPFGQFLMPFLRYAQKELQELYQQLTSYQSYIQRDSWISSVLQYLHNHLLTMVMKPLILEVNIAKLRDQLVGDTPEERFLSFIEEKITEYDDILAILTEYPPLARLLTETTVRTIANQKQLIERYLHDYHLITLKCQLPDHLVLAEVKIGEGDTHNQGKTVSILEFTNGYKIVYKPRSLGVDLAFQQLLSWLNQKGLYAPYKSLKIIDRHHYGWMEFIPYQECHNIDDVKRFYRRQGGYLTLLYLLNANDFHFENLIACGDHPYLIDLESLFHNQVDMDALTTALHEANKKVQSSVLKTNMLPVPLQMDGKHLVDLSGLGGKKGQLVTNQADRLQNDRTDNIQIGKGSVYTEEKQHLPRINGQAVEPTHYVDELIAGFQEVYHILLNDKEELEEVLTRFKRLQTRVILRSTQSYATLLHASYHPDYLQRGIDRNRLFDKLWIIVKHFPSYAQIVYSECRDLLQGDIPYFTTRIDSCSIWDSRGGKFPNFFPESGWSLVKKRLDSLSQRDLEEQIRYLYLSMMSLVNANDPQVPIRKTFHPKKGVSFHELATQIGEHFVKQSVWGQDYTDVTWLGICEQKGSLTFAPLGVGLYDGLMGIALFFAQLEKETQQIEYQELSYATTNSVIRYATHPANSLPLSGYYGNASILYGLACLYEIWSDEYFLSPVNYLLEKVKSQIPQDETFDLLSGSAGALLALLKLYKVTKNQQALELAKQCGNYLIQQKVALKHGLVWPSPLYEDPLGGMAHGVTGIALALYRLYQVTGEDNYLDTCRGALCYQESLFNERTGNWVDVRFHNQAGRVDLHAWCHGAPGIILAYSEMWDILNRSQKSAVRHALAGIINSPWHSNHSLCHGDFGNYLILKKVQDKFLTKKVNLEPIKLSIYQSIQKTGIRSGLPSRAESLGLMTGYAGIGLAMLAMDSDQLLFDPLSLS